MRLLPLLFASTLVLTACSDRGAESAAEPAAEATADIAMALVLAATRRLAEGERVISCFPVADEGGDDEAAPAQEENGNG